MAWRSRGKAQSRCRLLRAFTRIWTFRASQPSLWVALQGPVRLEKFKLTVRHDFVGMIPPDSCHAADGSGRPSLILSVQLPPQIPPWSRPHSGTAGGTMGGDTARGIPGRPELPYSGQASRPQSGPFAACHGERARVGSEGMALTDPMINLQDLTHLNWRIWSAPGTVVRPFSASRGQWVPGLNDEVVDERRLLRTYASTIGITCLANRRRPSIGFSPPPLISTWVTPAARNSSSSEMISSAEP